MTLTQQQASDHLRAVGIQLKRRAGEWGLHLPRHAEPLLIVETLEEAVLEGRKLALMQPKQIPPMGPVFRGVKTPGLIARQHNTKLLKSGRWGTAKK